MNLSYISGFFDADGSISLLSIHRNEHKSIQVSFCNNQLELLEEIEGFLETSLQIKGSISKKKARKPGHSDNFELKYTRNAALMLIEHLDSHHPKKKYRIDVALHYYQEVTVRNGKYSEADLVRKEAFNRLFYWNGKTRIKAELGSVFLNRQPPITQSPNPPINQQAPHQPYGS